MKLVLVRDSFTQEDIAIFLMKDDEPSQFNKNILRRLNQNDYKVSVVNMNDMTCAEVEKELADLVIEDRII